MKKIRKRLLYPALLAVIAGLVIASCSKYPSYTVNTSDLDMVWTNYSESADFMQYKTYFVPDTILIDSNATPEEKEYMQEYYEFILAAVNSNMQERNYVRVDSSDNPDMGIGISIISRKNYVYSYNWWYYYPPYWGWPGYGYYYPWYSYLGSYEEGALIIDLSDLKNINHDNRQIDALWGALIGGVLTNNSGLLDQRLQNYIDQAFEQSPYLLTNP
jgi:hypothetical protein